MKMILYNLLILADALAAILLARLTYRHWMKWWHQTITSRINKEIK